MLTRRMAATQAAVRLLLGATLVAAMLATSTVPAGAATVPVYAGWTLDGTGGAYTGTMVLPPGFPAATWASDSRAAAAVVSGASTWLPEGTPFGAVYGRSQNSQYLNLRPAADSGSAPSTTTYTFATPTPPSGWGFALGDIDADSVTVTALAADGTAVDAADLGFQGAFNYCDASPRSGACSGVSAPFDLPSVTTSPTSVTLTGNVIDTDGASGWFEPQVPISQLTMTFAWQAGLPIYQTWFATLTRQITGSVATTDGTPVAGATVRVTGPDGSLLATVQTTDDGGYAFPAGFAAIAGYTVSFDPPVGFGAVGPTQGAADLSTDDAVVDFPVEAQRYAVSGDVTDVDGGVPDAVLTVLADDGDVAGSDTTDDEGTFEITGLPDGTYTLTVDPPEGFVGEGPTSIPVEIAGADVAGIRFSVQPDPASTTTTAPATTSTSAPGAPTLPATGASTTTTASTLGAALLAAGVTLLAARRWVDSSGP